MSSTLLALLLFAPPVGGSAPANAIVAPHRAATDRTVQERQDGFVIVDRDVAPPAPAAIATVTLGAHVGIDRALVEGRGFPCGGAAR